MSYTTGSYAWTTTGVSGPNGVSRPNMRNLALRIVDARWFKLVLVVAIAGTAIAQGLSISFNVGVQFDIWLGTLWLLTILLLLLEVLARFIGLAPQVYRYFGDGWN